MPVTIERMKNPRTELDNLIAALQRHLEVASAADGNLDDSPVLNDAEEKLRDAFFTYDDALFTATGVELPFDILEDDDEDYDDDNDDFLDDDDEDEEEDDYLDEGDLENFDLNDED